MTDAGDEATLFPKTAGERLREAREAQGLSLAEVAARTRVPLRHLEAIEKSDYSGLPSPTYSVGFAKAYARAVGVDEVVVGREVRGHADATHRAPDYQPYEMKDPKRLPPQGLAVAAGAVTLIVLLAIGLWYGTTLFRGDGSEPVAVAAPAELAPPPVTTPPPPPVPVGGQVTLTAGDTVWLRVYDRSGKTLFQDEMKPGERYDVPADADHPMINVGRPDQIQVTVNGSTVPPLGDGKRAIKDVEVSAAALLARGSTAAAPTPAAPSAATPPSAAPSPVARRPAAVRRAPTPTPTRTRSTDAEDTARANAAAVEAMIKPPARPPVVTPATATPPAPQ
ncbi:MAG: hypothetical protein B7Y45_00625 [Sphingomonas sp. 28-66-16]|nr:MAG: hypothetical protein B7Y45_00625 [Sphingomonas sp. 28-66-16]